VVFIAFIEPIAFIVTKPSAVSRLSVFSYPKLSINPTVTSSSDVMIASACINSATG
jgi:hypothetical protein